MQAPTETAAPTGHKCAECGTINVAEARFCKQCGAAQRPPAACPSCGEAVPADARFCPGCGAKVLGPRPAAPRPAPAAARTPAPEAAPAVPAEAPVEDDAHRRALAAAAEALPAARRPSSSVGSNVLMFVAILMVLLVVIYSMNRDAPKEVSPFEGGPAPGSAPPSAAQPPSGGAEAVPAGDPVSGSVALAEGMEAPSGTLFVIVRMAGVERGPPLAVKKIEDPRFPQAFQVGPGDVMMKGMPFTGPFSVQARLDGDGNAMTKAPGDLVSSAGASGVKPGERVSLVLDQRL
jgi:hypothetical protein